MMAKPEVHCGIDERPPIHVAIFLGFQQFITMFCGTLTTPLLVSTAMCISSNDVARAELMGTILFTSGLVTFLQCTLGTRLPIVQGGSFSFMLPTFAILSLPKWACPAPEWQSGQNSTNLNESFTELDEPLWKPRMREIQGAIIVASLFQVVLGLSGLVGLLLRFCTPLVIAPTITLIGLSLSGVAADYSSKQWWIAMMTIVLIALFSQHLRSVQIPCFMVTRKRSCIRKGSFYVFKLFPVILALSIMWLLCFVLTITDVFPNDPNASGYHARTDTKLDIIQNAQWFRFPYPLQYGIPTVSVASVLGMLTGVVTGIIESVGDYYACARLSGAPVPPVHAINRGIFVEGIGCVLTELWGTGAGSTSFSQNVGVIGITKVGSRFVIQISAFMMICLGVFGKFGALFMTIPEPVVGGIFMVMFAMVAAVGISNLQYVDLNSSRNLFIFGFSIFLGLCLPTWITQHPGYVRTGVSFLDQLFTILLSTSMFVGGVTGFILDNTIPGTAEERGLMAWSNNQQTSATTAPAKDGEVDDKETIGTYDLPLVMSFIRRWKWTSYVPICPTFRGIGCECRRAFNGPEKANMAKYDCNHDEMTTAEELLPAV